MSGISPPHLNEYTYFSKYQVALLNTGLSYTCRVLLLMALEDSSPPTASDSHVLKKGKTNSEIHDLHNCTNTLI